MTVREVTPTYEHVQWTGTNADDVAVALAAYYGTTFGTEELDDGALRVTSGAYSDVIPADHWYLMGPNYGQLRTGQSLVVDPDTYTAKYQAI